MANTNKLTPEGVSLTGKIVQIWVETEPQKNKKKGKQDKITRPTGQSTRTGDLLSLNRRAAYLLLDLVKNGGMLIVHEIIGNG